MTSGHGRRGYAYVGEFICARVASYAGVAADFEDCEVKHSSCASNIRAELCN